MLLALASAGLNEKVVIFHLVHLQQMFRLYAFNRNAQYMDASLKRFARYNEETKIFDIPEMSSLLGYQLIVSTCSTSGNLYGVGVTRGHFTHIILDEAAQMMEAEALIPLSMADKKISIVMAGDDKQLGVVIQSESGLSSSFIFSQNS